jgi:hypothetical protein
MTDRAPLPGTVSIRAARESEVPHILALIRELAAYEHLEHQVVATEPELAAALFAPRPYGGTASAGDCSSGWLTRR